MTTRTVTEVKVVDVEKRRLPSKHYVYKISVTWSEGSTLVIYRRYSKFFDLQVRLLELFPEEGGTKDPTQRMIPFLPGKKIFGRSHVREVALKRLNPIDEYCRNLVRLPPKVSECDTVLEFFKVWPEDNDFVSEEEYQRRKKSKDTERVGESITDPILLEQYTAIADYKKQRKNEVNLKEGELIEVIEKNENGWWFVRVDYEQGWVPASYLEKADGTEEPEEKRAKPGNEEPHITVKSYTAENDDEITFDQGVAVDVIQKNLDGWWLVRYQGKEGWAPSAYLTKMKVLPEETGGSAVQIVGSAFEAAQSATEEKQKQQSNQDAKSPSSSPGNKARDAGKKKSAPVKPSTPSVSQGDASSLIAASLAASAATAKPTPRRYSIKKTRSKNPASAGALGKISETVKSKQNRDSRQYFVAIAAYESQDPSSLTFEAGAKAEVVQQDPNGWWFIHIGDREGWAPSTYFELAGSPPTQQKRANTEEQLKRKAKTKAPAPPKQAPKAKKKKKVTQYKTIATFESQAEDGISFEGGQVVDVEEKAPSGWWYVRIGGKEGWAPSSYIESSEVEVEEEVNEPPVLPTRALLVTENDASDSVVDRQAARQAIKPAAARDKEPDDEEDGTKDVNAFASAIAARAQRAQTTFSKSTDSETKRPPGTARRTTTSASTSNVPPQANNPLAAALAARAAKISEEPASKSENQHLRETSSKPSVEQSHTEESNPLAAALAARSARLESQDNQTSEQRPSLPAARKPVAMKPPRTELTGSTPVSREDKTQERRLPAPRPRKATTEANSTAAALTSRIAKMEGESQREEKTDTTKATRVSPRVPRKLTSANKPVKDDKEDNQASVLAAALVARQSKMESETQSPHGAAKKPVKVPPRLPNKSPVKAIASTDGKQIAVTIADFDSDADGFKFKAGKSVDVIEKHENGWWYIKVGGSEGWAPSTYIEEKKQTELLSAKKSPPTRPSNSPALSRKVAQAVKPVKQKSEEKKDLFVTTADFTAQDSDGISFKTGQNVTVIERNPNGWWFVRVGEREGWAPSTYLEEKKTTKSPLKPGVTSKQEDDSRSKGVALPGLPVAQQNSEGSKHIKLPGLTEKNSEKHQNGHSGQPLPAKRSNSPAAKKGGNPDDSKEKYSTVAAYTAEDQQGISFVEGETVRVIEKDENGWWFIKIGTKEGWAPCTYLEKSGQSQKAKPTPLRPVTGPKSKRYQTVAAYSDDGITFNEGESVEVLERANSGWWFVKIGNKEGWAPSTYIEEC